MTPISALKSALLDHLKAATAGGPLADKIFDEVPRDDQGGATSVDAPFLYLGPVGWQRLEGGDGPGFTVRLRLYVVSTAFGREESWDLAEAVRAALERVELNDRLAALGGHAHTGFRVMSCGDVVTPLDPKQVFLELATELFSASP